MELVRFLSSLATIGINFFEHRVTPAQVAQHLRNALTNAQQFYQEPYKEFIDKTQWLATSIDCLHCQGEHFYDEDTPEAKTALQKRAVESMRTYSLDLVSLISSGFQEPLFNNVPSGFIEEYQRLVVDMSCGNTPYDAHEKSLSWWKDAVSDLQMDSAVMQIKKEYLKHIINKNV